MITKKLILTFSIGLLLTACSPDVVKEVTKQPDTVPPIEVTEVDTKPTDIQIDEEGYVTMDYEEKIVRFKIAPTDTTAAAVRSPVSIFDNDQTNTQNIMVETGSTVLEIGKSFFGPYQTMNEFKSENISFECDGTPILNLREGNIAVAKCSTNGTDYLEQFECTPGNVNVIVTGGEVVLYWSKIYLKKIDGEIYVFSGRLPMQMGVEYFENDTAISQYCTEDELDEIIAKSDEYNSKANVELIREWDELVESFKIAEKEMN